MPRFAKLSGEFEIATGAGPDEVIWRLERTADIDREFTFADEPGRSRPQARVMLPVMLGALRGWEGVLDAAGRPVPYSEQAFYEYVPSPLRLELLDRWTRRMRGTTPDGAAGEAPPTAPTALGARVGLDEAAVSPAAAAQQPTDEAGERAPAPEPLSTLTSSPRSAGEGPTTMAQARGSGESDAAEWPPPAAPAAPGAPMNEAAVGRRAEPQPSGSLEPPTLAQPPAGFPDGPKPSDAAPDSLPSLPPIGDPFSPDELPPPRTPDVENETALAPPSPADEPTPPIEAAVVDESAMAAAAVEAPLTYSAEPAFVASQAPDALEVPTGPPQPGVEPFLEPDRGSVPPPPEPSPSAEPITDALVPEPPATDPSSTLERRGSDLEPEVAPAALVSALDDPDLDLDWRLQDAVEAMYRRNRRAEQSEPLF
jgi:hypothetical protein